MNSFSEQVHEIVGQIPYSKVVSYGQIAWMLGRPGAARAVGQAMRNCPPKLPWHRVILSDGSIAKSEHGELHKAMLKAEDVPFLSAYRVDIKKCCWRR